MSEIFDTAAQQYIAVWNETDPQQRRSAIEKLWSEDGVYVDPLGEANGHEAIDSMIAAVQQQFSNMTFRLIGPVDGHHNQLRFTWEVGPEDGDAPVVGFDVATLDDTGKVNQVLGFLDKVPAQ